MDGKSLNYVILSSNSPAINGSQMLNSGERTSVWLLPLENHPGEKQTFSYTVESGNCWAKACCRTCKERHHGNRSITVK
jgi:hypothetical protein